MNQNMEGMRRRIASGTSVDRLRVESNGSLERLNTASPVLWDSLLQNLSAALPVIFNTPTASDKDDLSFAEPQLISVKCLHPDTCGIGVRSSTAQGNLSALERKRPVSGDCGTEEEIKQDFKSVPTDPGRQIRVRHEETEDMLNQSLSMICRQKSPRVLSSLDPLDENRKSAGLRMKESLKSGVRVKINISEYSVDDIVVAVTSDNILTVYIAGDETQKLYTLQLLPTHSVPSLVCSVVDEMSLYIREKSKEAMVYEYSGNTSRFLPVILLDETLLKFTIVYHIPEQFCFENVMIKTIDESLVIKGCHSSSSVDQSGDFFRVMMALPEGADNRSVTARMIEHNQVIIEGCLGLSSRRMTCNF